MTRLHIVYIHSDCGDVLAQALPMHNIYINIRTVIVVTDIPSCFQLRILPPPWVMGLYRDAQKGRRPLVFYL